MAYKDRDEDTELDPAGGILDESEDGEDEEEEGSLGGGESEEEYE